MTYIFSTPLNIQSTLLHKCTWKLKYIGNIPKSNTFEGAGGCKGGAPPKPGGAAPVCRGCKGGAKGGAPPKVRGCEGGAAPVSEGAPPSCTPKYFTNQGAPPNVASPKQHPPKLHQQMLHSRRLLWGHNGKDVKIVLQCVNK